MTVLHGAITGAEVDLPLPLKEKLTAVSELPAHIVTFREHLARLATGGQAPLVLDAFRLFFWHRSPHSLFSTSTLCCLLWLTGQLDSKRSSLRRLRFATT
jgi:hypothetical protein